MIRINYQQYKQIRYNMKEGRKYRWPVKQTARKDSLGETLENVVNIVKYRLSCPSVRNKETNSNADEQHLSAVPCWKSLQVLFLILYNNYFVYSLYISRS